MEINDKQLLLQDLCGRLPFGVIVKDRNGVHELTSGNTEFTDLLYNGKCNIKPYLFPLSSMTEEQRKEYETALTYHDYVEGGWTIAKTFNNEYVIPYWFVDFCNKHHFDYRGLIEKGLATDATGLNIYDDILFEF